VVARRVGTEHREAPVNALAARLPAELAARSVLLRLVAENAWLPALLALFGTAVAALLERKFAPFGAADRALSGAGLGVALPLLAYALLDAGLGNQRLRRCLEPIARHGGDVRAAGAGALAAFCVVLAFAGALLAAVAVLAARSMGDPMLGRDLAASVWIGALAGAAYAGWFALGSTFGQRGGGRKWVLALDFVLGATSGVLALPWPRAHVRNLLGGAPPFDLGQGAASLGLLAMTALTMLVALGRTTR